MSDSPRFEVNVFPAHFDDASKGTIVSITYRSDTPIFPPKLSALRALAQHEFDQAVKNHSPEIVTSKINDTPQVNDKYTVAAALVPHLIHKHRNL